MIITNDEAKLRVFCEPVLPEEIASLIEQLEKELDHCNRMGRSGIGLAAPQIGIAKNIAIVRLPKNNLNLVNAQLIFGYDKTFFREEGCLSFPGRVENTLRFQEVHMSSDTMPCQFIATGLLAVACQHELDHVNSTLFMDRKAPVVTTIKNNNKVDPNDLCPCGKIDTVTGKIKKYKKCCKK